MSDTTIYVKMMNEIQRVYLNNEKRAILGGIAQRKLECSIKSELENIIIDNPDKYRFNIDEDLERYLGTKKASSVNICSTILHPKYVKMNSKTVEVYWVSNNSNVDKTERIKHEYFYAAIDRTLKKDVASIMHELLPTML